MKDMLTKESQKPMTKPEVNERTTNNVECNKCSRGYHKGKSFKKAYLSDQIEQSEIDRYMNSYNCRFY